MTSPVTPAQQAQVNQAYSNYLTKLKSLVAKKTSKLTAQLKQAESKKIEQVKQEIEHSN